MPTVISVFLLNGVQMQETVLDNGSIITEPYTGGPVPGIPTTLADLCNMALDTVNASPNIGGAWGITPGELAAPITPQGILVSRNYVEWIQEVMREYEWPELTSRMRLLGNGTVALTLVDTTTPGAFVPSDTITITPASAYFTAKDVGRNLFEQPVPGVLPAATGLNGTATIVSVNTAVIPVATATVTFAFTSASLPTLAVQGWGLAPLAGFKRAYALPSDSIKLRSLEDNLGNIFGWGRRSRHGLADSWQVEGQFVLSDMPNPIAVYTFYDPDPSNWDKLLREAVVAKMAAELTWPLTKNEKLKQMNFSIYKSKLTDADGVMRTDRQRHGYSATTFLDVRG